MKYILVRHGECMLNIEKDMLVPSSLSALTENGKIQSRTAAERIKAITDKFAAPPIHLYFSPYVRTKYMANEIIDRVKCDVICEEPLISEIQCGKFFSDAQYQKDYPEEYECLKSSKAAKTRFWYRFKDGESPFDVYVRLRIFFDRLNLSEDGVAIIVSHQVTLRVLTMILLNKGIAYFEDGVRFANGEIVLIENQTLFTVDEQFS